MLGVSVDSLTSGNTSTLCIRYECASPVARPRAGGKPDKYDRYLADVFLAQDGEPVYLNNALLAAGHAVVKKEWEFSDWGG